MNIFSIYFAGLLSFFSPCILPIVPLYFYAMMEEENYSRKKLFIRGVIFCLGFMLIFILMGIGAGGLSSSIREHRSLIDLIAGTVILILALDFIGIINIPFLQRSYSPNYSRLKTSMPLLNSFLLGLLFALTWSPCIGAVLGGILTYVSAVSETALKGGYYLFIYGLGISTPLLAASIFFERLKGFSSRNQLFINSVKKILGLVLIFFAITLFSQVLKLADIENKKEIQYASTILMPDKLPVFLMITESGCESCERAAIIVDELKRSCGDKIIDFREVNVKNPNYAYVAIELGVPGAPSFIVLSREGEELIRLYGEKTVNELNDVIKKVTGKICI